MIDDVVLTIDNVSLESESLQMLKNVSFSISRGENIVLFGPENSGLNLFFPLLLVFQENFEGEIFYRGKTIRDFSYIERHEYRKNIGYIHPDFGLINNMNVKQNISLPLEYHSTLGREDIVQFVNNMIYTLNLDHCKNLRPVDLSRSEILKTAYARAIALDPDMLFIEHAFEGQSLLNIQSFLKSLNMVSSRPDKSVVVITYEPEMFQNYADTFIMFFSGRIVFKGNKKEFVESENRFLIQYKNRSTSGPMPIL